MFFLSLFLLLNGMLAFSLVIGIRHSKFYTVQLTLNFLQRGIYNYTFGLHHSATVGRDSKGAKFRVESLSIGLIIATFEFNFYKDLPGNFQMGPEQH